MFPGISHLACYQQQKRPVKNKGTDFCQKASHQKQLFYTYRLLSNIRIISVHILKISLAWLPNFSFFMQIIYDLKENFAKIHLSHWQFYVWKWGKSSPVYHMLSRIGRMCVAKRLLTEKSFDILYTLYMSRSNITRYWTQYDKWKTKTLFKLWTHKRHPMFHPYGQVMASEIAKTLGFTLIRHQSDTSVSDWCLINVDPRVFAIWDVFSDFFGDKTLWDIQSALHGDNFPWKYLNYIPPQSKTTKARYRVCFSSKSDLMFPFCPCCCNTVIMLYTKSGIICCFHNFKYPSWCKLVTLK